MGSSTLACRVALSVRHAILIGMSGGGRCFLVGGVGVITLFGYHSLPCDSSAAAPMLCVWCSHESVDNMVLMSSSKQPLSQRDGGSL